MVMIGDWDWGFDLVSSSIVCGVDWLADRS